MVERVSVEENRDVLVIIAPRAARMPVACRGVAYERVLNTTRTTPRETYQRFSLEEMHSTARWENQPALSLRALYCPRQRDGVGRGLPQADT
jgi:hypothetical protein